jgi:predicted esterase
LFLANQERIISVTGEADPMVPFTFGKMSAELMKSFSSTNHEFKTYPGLGHSSSEQVREIENGLSLQYVIV